MNSEDLPGPAMIYWRCVESGERLGIEPPSAERVRELVSEWNSIIEATHRVAEIGPQRTH